MADYPQLRQIAWQIRADEVLTPVEAWDIYRRNWRHVDVQAMTSGEQQLFEALKLGLGNDTRDAGDDVRERTSPMLY